MDFCTEVSLKIAGASAASASENFYGVLVVIKIGRAKRARGKIYTSALNSRTEVLENAAVPPPPAFQMLPYLYILSNLIRSYIRS